MFSTLFIYICHIRRISRRWWRKIIDGESSKQRNHPFGVDLTVRADHKGLSVFGRDPAIRFGGLYPDNTLVLGVDRATVFSANNINKLKAGGTHVFDIPLDRGCGGCQI